jgi:hypothetical protein
MKDIRELAWIESERLATEMAAKEAEQHERAEKTARDNITRALETYLHISERHAAVNSHYSVPSDHEINEVPGNLSQIDVDGLRFRFSLTMQYGAQERHFGLLSRCEKVVSVDSGKCGGERYFELNPQTGLADLADALAGKVEGDCPQCAKRDSLETVQSPIVVQAITCSAQERALLDNIAALIGQTAETVLSRHVSEFHSE